MGILSGLVLADVFRRGEASSKLGSSTQSWLFQKELGWLGSKVGKFDLLRGMQTG